MPLGFGSIKRMKGKGDPIRNIVLRYWLPESITQFIFIILPPLLDSYFVASLKSTAMYGSLSAANTILHVLLKVSEAIPVASVAIIGRHNGAGEYEKCGRDLGDTFWTSTFIGLMQFVFIFFAASGIYRMLGVPTDMIALGVPFLRLRSLGVFLVFIAAALLYFMRGIKNTRIPMIISLTGIISFITFEGLFVAGWFGFPQLGLYGAAMATIVQYAVMITLAAGYLLINRDYRKYFPTLFIWHFNIWRVLHLLNLSWQIMIDKTVLATSYVWLFKMLAPLGKYAITSFDVIKNLERLAFLPAVAFAQVITFLVSNKLGESDPEGAKANIKKVLIVASVFTGSALFALCIKARYFVSFFDPLGKFTDMAAPALVLVSTLIIFDFIQLILAGSLRGAGDVRTVMLTRVCCCIFFFAPFAYLVSKIPIESTTIKFALIYSTFYINTGLIGFIYMKRILGSKWQRIKV